MARFRIYYAPADRRWMVEGAADGFSGEVVTAEEYDKVVAALRAELEKARESMTPEPNQEYEAKAAAFRDSMRATEDGKPEGTADALERCAKMLDTYGPDCFPANDLGQVHFARAMMESTADEIRAFVGGEFAALRLDLSRLTAELGQARAALEEIAERDCPTVGGEMDRELFRLTRFQTAQIARAALAPA